jgi:PAS domain S-box-containing protein
VTEAGCARTGLRDAQLFPPDLILCDLKLGQGSGYDVLTELRRRSDTATIPLILITASDDASVMRHGMDLGADDFLHKPFTAQQLLAAVDARLRRQSQLRARADQILRDVEARHRLLFEGSAEAIMVLAPPAWRFVEANAATLRMFGAPTKARFLAMSPWEVSPEQQPDGSPSAERARIMIESALRDGSHLFEWMHRRFDGEVFPASVLLARLELSGQRLIQATVHDLAEQRRAEAQVRKLSRAVEQSPASVLITDTAGRIEYVNPKFCSMTGYQPAEVLGQNPRILKSGETAPEVYREMWQRITRGEEWRGELHNRKKNGERFWELAVISPIKNERGETTHFLGIKEDITERKQAEHDRHLMDIHLRQAQKLESIGQLAAGIAHEINTPTQYVGDNVRFFNRAFADLDRVLDVHDRLVSWLKEQGPLPEAAAQILEEAAPVRSTYLRREIPKALGDALEGVERVSRIVRAMKEFSHPGTEEKQQVDLNHAIESTLTVSRNEWKYVAELVTRLDPELPRVPCLPGEFNQVILNLIVNAAHAIADVVKGEPGRKGRITVSTKAVADWVEVRVQDTGPGIPARIQHRIFEPFFTTKSVGKGSGQGLALARSVIVERHGGTIHFETEPGKGTTFVLRLPVAMNGKEPASSA